MKGMFVNADGFDFADAIVRGDKVIETRNRAMLDKLIGERVAVVRTKRGRKPEVIGTVFVKFAFHFGPKDFEIYREDTLIPKGSKYDCTENGKWCYFLRDAERCEPYPLPENAVRHGISWVEFDGPGEKTIHRAGAVWMTRDGERMDWEEDLGVFISAKTGEIYEQAERIGDDCIVVCGAVERSGK